MFLTKKIITIFAFNNNENRNDYDRKSNFGFSGNEIR